MLGAGSYVVPSAPPREARFERHDGGEEPLGAAACSGIFSAPEAKGVTCGGGRGAGRCKAKSITVRLPLALAKLPARAQTHLLDNTNDCAHRPPLGGRADHPTRMVGDQMSRCGKAPGGRGNAGAAAGTRIVRVLINGKGGGERGTVSSFQVRNITPDQSGQPAGR